MNAFAALIGGEIAQIKLGIKVVVFIARHDYTVASVRSADRGWPSWHREPAWRISPISTFELHRRPPAPLGLQGIAPPERADGPVDEVRLSEDMPQIDRNSQPPTEFRDPETVEPLLEIAEVILLELGIDR
jgi:hypothetical protein